ncbi:MAG: type III secretion inner membrane ring lipoprotein SctJ [Rhizobiaceae bacterium]|nr:type III secretion inner membrane ring lipoprotein SctJ [Rhizobiaceae bacterium]
MAHLLPIKRLVASIVRARLALVLCLVASLAGCKTDVYSNLTEREANEMMAVLMSNGVRATKSTLGEAFVLQVEQDDMLRAISLLSDKGYPKNSRDSIGSIFQKSGIISSPFEERVRYIYALGEDVAQTISEIDGVVAARVHVVLPQEPDLGQPVKPSSAAVFIKHEPTVDLEFFVPQIRRLVSSAIEGLDYAAVTVVLTEATPVNIAPALETERTVNVMPGLAVREADVGFFWLVAYSGVGLLVLLLSTSIAGLVLALRGRRRSTALVRVEAPGNAGLEPS